MSKLPPSTELLMADLNRFPHLSRMVEAARKITTQICAVAHPCDEESLEGPLSAAKLGIIKPILVGPAARIHEVATAGGHDLTGIEIIDTPHSHASAETAVELAHTGRAQAVMKGSLHSDELLEAVLDRTKGLRTGRRISHVFAFDVPSYHKPLFITDAAVNIFPDLATKVDIVQNVIDLCLALKIASPKIAILSAVETVNPKIPSTLEAAALCKMADRGQIKGGLLDGPLAFDNAISAEAARIKGITSKVSGDADVLLVPDLEAGNMLAKQLRYLAGADGAGILLGTRLPVVLTSRADSTTARLASVALASLLAHAKLNA